MKNPMVDKLKWYIGAGLPILYIQTFEEGKADGIIADAAGKKGVYEWNGSDGLVDFKTKTTKSGTIEPSLEAALMLLKTGKFLNHRLLVIKDVAELMKPDRQFESRKIVALLKDIARKIRNQDIDSTVIIVSPTVHIPKDLEKLITVLKLELPKEDEIRSIIEESAKVNNLPAVYPGLLDEMATAFKGLSNLEIEDLLALAISQDDGELNRKALQLIFEQKKQMILKAGILELVPVKESINDIGGLEVLKGWLQKKAKVFENIKAAMEFGVPMPKGVLIAGTPGCGKSLTAKAASRLLGVPLLKLDMGRLMGKYVGESEENMRRAIELAEAMSPCVLWVDELEKAFAGISGGGSEVTTRLFGTFLTWMQEKTCATFVIATANKIVTADKTDLLPPELLRKGRFDEIFYVALPNPEERRKIFEIHLTKRRKADVGSIDIGRLVSKTEGYSGADIESVVGESVESAFVKKMPQLTTEEILNCIKNTHPLSEIMKEQLAEMSQIYEDRKFTKASR